MRNRWSSGFADVRAGRMHDQEMTNQWALAAQMFVSPPANSPWRGVMQMSFTARGEGASRAYATGSSATLRRLQPLNI
jgi:hypothetical protein